MARVVLVTGGSRSGKSAYALKLGESAQGQRLFVATCPVMDEELAERVRKHRAARGDRWETLEEPLALADALRKTKEYPVVVVDCLTLWVGNLLYDAEQRGEALTEEGVSERCCEVLLACAVPDSRTAIFVTNEVGMGIVPDNALARRYRDLAGRCNRVIAEGANEVVLMVCGVPVQVK